MKWSMCRWVTNTSLTRRTTRRQRREVAKIEHQGTSLEHEVDVKARIAERIVDKLRIKVPRHDSLCQLEEIKRRTIEQR